MNQDIKKSNLSDVKTIVSKNFVGAMQEMSIERIEVNAPDLVQKVIKDKSNFAKIGKAQGRYITLDAIYEAVNGLGLNANFIFVENGPEKEKLLREGAVVINDNMITGGDNPKIINVTPVFQSSSGNISVAKQIIHGIPEEERREIKKQMDDMNAEMNNLKKTTEFLQNQLLDRDKEIKEKDQKLLELHDRIYQLMVEQKQK